MSPDDVLAELTALQTGDVPTHGGATMAYVYDSGRADVDEVAAAAQAAFQWTNALDPTAFPSVARSRRRRPSWPRRASARRRSAGR